jgi:hypothetical protein
MNRAIKWRLLAAAADCQAGATEFQAADPAGHSL